MSTSKKTLSSIRQVGPGASHENATKPPDAEKPAADNDNRTRSKVTWASKTVITRTIRATRAATDQGIPPAKEKHSATVAVISGRGSPWKLTK